MSSSTLYPLSNHLLPSLFQIPGVSNLVHRFSESKSWEVLILPSLIGPIVVLWFRLLHMSLRVPASPSRQVFAPVELSVVLIVPKPFRALPRSLHPATRRTFLKPRHVPDTLLPRTLSSSLSSLGLPCLPLQPLLLLL